MAKPENKFVVYLDETLSPGVAMNTTLHLGTQFGTQQVDIAGPKAVDASNVEHSGLPIYPNVVLAVSAAELKVVIERSRSMQSDAKLDMLDYPEQGFTTYTDEDYRSEVARTPNQEIRIYGCLVYGSKNQVSKLSRKLKTVRLWDGVEPAANEP